MKKKNKNKNKQKPYNLEFCHDLMMLVLYPGRPCNRTCHWLAGFMVLQANFNNISVISWLYVLLVEETASHWQTLSHNVVHLVMSEIQRHNISSDRH